MVLALVGGVPGGGTRYTAHVMSACGIPTGHERMLRENPNVMRPTPDQIEVSWLCVPWFKMFKGLNLLMARAPYNVIRNQYAAGFLLKRPKPLFLDDVAYWDIMLESGINRLAAFYYRWMSWGINYADAVLSVHDLTSDKLRYLPKINFPNVDGIKDVATDTNTRSHTWTDMDIPWHDLKPHHARNLEHLANDLGVPEWVE